MNGRRDVRVVESILAAVITPNVALTTETTSCARLVAFHRHGVIVRPLLRNLSTHDWRIRRIVFIGTADILCSES